MLRCISWRARNLVRYSLFRRHPDVAVADWLLFSVKTIQHDLKRQLSAMSDSTLSENEIVSDQSFGDANSPVRSR